MGITWQEPDPTSSGLERVMSNFSGMVRQVGWRYRLSEADIDELIQDVRIRLWRAHANGAGVAGLRGGENLEDVPASYVYRTATTAALDLIRRRRAGRAASHEDIETAELVERVVDYSLVNMATPQQEVETSEVVAQVERAIETIPTSRRAVVRMYLAGYPREEIAELMGWTEAKTRNLLYRGLSDLRTCLTKWGIGWGGVAR